MFKKTKTKQICLKGLKPKYLIFARIISIFTTYKYKINSTSLSLISKFVFFHHITVLIISKCIYYIFLMNIELLQ